MVFVDILLFFTLMEMLSLVLYPLSMMLFCELRWALFYRIKEESIHSYLINFNRSQTLSNAFLVFIKIIIVFFLCTSISMMKSIMTYFYTMCPCMLSLCDPMDCSLPGSGIPQARIVKWIAVSFSRGSSRPRDEIRISCIGRQVLFHFANWEVHFYIKLTI